WTDAGPADRGTGGAADHHRSRGGCPGPPGRADGIDPFRVASRRVPARGHAGAGPGGPADPCRPDRTGGVAMRSERIGGGRIRKVVVVVPSAFTLGNLFFGFWAIVSGINGNF